MRFRLPLLFAAVALPAIVVVGCSSPSGDEDAVIDDGAVTTGDDSGVTTGDDASTGTDTGTTPGTDSGAATDAKPSDTGTTPAADTGTPPSGDWPAAYAALEQQILEETNKRRALGADCRTGGKFGPAGPLVMQPQLQAAARKHSKDMATNGFFAHTNLAGLSPFDRMKAEGYKGTTMGENIAAGNATAAQTMTQWMNSDGHCANIMNPKYKQLGVGYWYSASSKYRHYWTQNFGAGG